MAASSWLAPVQFVHPAVPTLLLMMAAVIVVIAAVTDLRRHMIYNWLTLPAIALGLLLNGTLGGAPGVVASVLGCLVGGGALLPFFLMGGFGGGDVKLMAAVGALGGIGLVLPALLLTALAGGVMGLIQIGAKGAWGQALRNLGRIVRLQAVEAPTGEAQPLTIPYGLAIALGTLTAIALRYAGVTIW